METCRIRSFRLRILRNQVANHQCGKFDIEPEATACDRSVHFLSIREILTKKTDTKHPVNTKCNIATYLFSSHSSPSFFFAAMHTITEAPTALYFITPSLVFFRICFVVVRRFVPIPKSLLQSSSRKQWMYHNTLVSLVHSGLSSCLVLYW